MIQLTKEQELKVKNDIRLMYHNFAVHKNKSEYLTDQGVDAIYEQWCIHKEPLYNELSKHPNWNQEALAIVSVEEVIVPYSTRDKQNALQNLRRHANKFLATPEDIIKISKRYSKDNVENYFLDGTLRVLGGKLYLHNQGIMKYDIKNQDILNLNNGILSLMEQLNYSNTIPNDISETNFNLLSSYVKTITGKSINKGMKSARIINSIFEALKVDKSYTMVNNGGKNVSVYEHYYALCGDAFSEKKKKVVLQMSIHPANFIGQSYGKYDSCHNPWGGYCSGASGYLCDDVSVVLAQYEYDKERTNNVYTLDIQTKRIMCYIDLKLKKGLISRLYPQVNETSVAERETLRQYTEKIIKTLFGSYTDKSCNSYDPFARSFVHRANTIYPDWIEYTHAKYNVFVWGDNDLETRQKDTVVGGTAICYSCGELYDKDLIEKNYFSSGGSYHGYGKCVCPECSGNYTRKKIIGYCAECGEPIYDRGNYCTTQDGRLCHGSCSFTSELSGYIFPNSEKALVSLGVLKYSISKSEIELYNSLTNTNLVYCQEEDMYIDITKTVCISDGIYCTKEYAEIHHPVIYDFNIDEFWDDIEQTLLGE